MPEPTRWILPPGVMIYDDADWERAAEAGAQALADAMGWHCTGADRKMASIITAAVRAELERQACPQPPAGVHSQTKRRPGAA